MKILVCLKQVPHRDARLEVAGAWINEANLKFEINDYDSYGLEAALRIKDANQAEVVVVSIGPDRVVQSLRTALGMGAPRAALGLIVLALILDAGRVKSRVAGAPA